MLTVDTVKLCVPLEAGILDFNLNHDRFVKHSKTELGHEIITYQVKCEGILGLNSVKIASNDTAEIQLSAKALSKDYLKLINKNTILQALERVNQLECFKIDPLQVLDSAILHRLDICLDIPLDDYQVNEALQALETIHNRAYTLSPYPSQGIVIQKNAISNNCREIFYNKGEEVIRDKELLLLCNPDDFQGLLRSELNLRKFTYLRKYLNIKHKGNIRLSEALLSNEKPNARYFQEFENPIPSLFAEVNQFKTYDEFARAKGEETILKELNYNEAQYFQLIRHFFKDKKSIYRVMKRIKPLKEKLLINESPKAINILKHIREYLKAGHRSTSEQYPEASGMILPEK
jgi:hypothetical protein